MHVSRDSLESPLETVKAEKDGLSDAVIEMCGTACKDTLPSSSAAENRAWGPTGGSATDGADCGLKRIASEEPRSCLPTPLLYFLGMAGNQGRQRNANPGKFEHFPWRRARFGSVRQMLQSVPLMTKVLLAWVTVETVLITAYTGVVLATGARQQFVCVLLVTGIFLVYLVWDSVVSRNKVQMAASMVLVLGISVSRIISNARASRQPEEPTAVQVLGWLIIPLHAITIVSAPALAHPHGKRYQRHRRNVDRAICMQHNRKLKVQAAQFAKSIRMLSTTIFTGPGGFCLAVIQLVHEWEHCQSELQQQTSPSCKLRPGHLSGRGEV